LRTLALVHGEHDSSLVVFDGSEDTRLVRRDGSVSRKDDTENVALHGDTEGERSNIEKEKVGSFVGSLTSKDCGLDSSAVGDSLVRIDRLVELTATEVLRDKGLDLGDTRGATDEDNVVDLSSRNL